MSDAPVATFASELSNAEVLSPLELLTGFETINVAAPLVRYSKSPFRRLVSEYNTHITHTPMMVAREFSRSSVGRDADFSIMPSERGVFELVEVSLGSRNVARERHPHKRRRLIQGCLVAQFGANEVSEMAQAAELVGPYVDGIDLNCGCPVKGHAAGPNGIGSALLRRPELVADIIRMTKSRASKTVSLKIRLDPDLKHTEALIQTAAKAGADYISIHGRTRYQSSTHPVDTQGMAFASQVATSCGLPVIANGDVWDLTEAGRLRKECRVQAVMSARGLLANPALFAGFKQTPSEAVERFVGYAVQAGLPFALGHRQLAYMLESHFLRSDRLHFNSLASYASAIDMLGDLGMM